MKVIIATQNEGKIEGAKRAFSKYFKNLEIIGIPVPSDVSEQPLNEEILQGAENRIHNLKKYCSDNNITADLFLAIESGITNQLGAWFITNIAVISDNHSFVSFGTSPSFPVPEKFVNEIIQSNLNKFMCKLFNKEINLHNKKGGIELLTHGKLNRIDLTEQAFIMALTSFINSNWQ